MGVGVSALPSVLKQSCLPNSHFLNSHGNLVVFAGRRIKKGEEILVSYIKYYPDNPLQERLTQVFLRYGYVCKCEACANNLPSLEQLKKSPLKFLNNIEAENARKEFIEFAKPILIKRSCRTVSMKSLLEIAFACRGWVDKNVVTPSYDGFLSQKILFVCMQQSYDNFCQNIPEDDGRALARACIMTLASRAQIDVDSLSSVFDRTNLKRFLNP